MIDRPMIETDITWPIDRSLSLGGASRSRYREIAARSRGLGHIDLGSGLGRLCDGQAKLGV